MNAKETPPRLGRGLAALLGDATSLPNGDADGVRTLAIDVLEPSTYQPRRSATHEGLDELVASVRSRGILQPLLARPHPDRPGRYQLIAGERRWHAAQAAGLHEVPVLVRPLADADAMAAALVENLQRLDLNPMEEADGYRRLIDEFALSQQDLAEAVGKSRSHVANMLRLRNLPAPVQDQVRSGALSAGHARALLPLADPERAAAYVIARGLNVRQTEALATQPARDSPATRSQAKDPDLVAVERDLAARLGMRVQVSATGNAGNVRIQYRSLDQLEALIALLMRD